MAHMKLWSCSGFITSLWQGANGASPLPLHLLWLCVLHVPARLRLVHCHFDWYFHIVWLKAGVLNGGLSIKLSWFHRTESAAAWMTFFLLFFIIALSTLMLWSRVDIPRYLSLWFDCMPFEVTHLSEYSFSYMERNGFISWTKTVCPLCTRSPSKFKQRQLIKLSENM